MKEVVALLIVILIGGCDWLAEHQICQVPHSELFGMAWEEQLDKQGIIFNKKGGKICYPERFSVKARRANFTADEIYRGAAELAKTKPHRERIISWLKHEKRDYEESLVDTDEYLIVVFSGSENQYDETKLMLNCLQYQENCNE